LQASLGISGTSVAGLPLAPTVKQLMDKVRAPYKTSLSKTTHDKLAAGIGFVLMPAASMSKPSPVNQALD